MTVPPQKTSGSRVIALIQKTFMTALALAVCGLVQISLCATDSRADIITAVQLNDYTAVAKINQLH